MRASRKTLTQQDKLDWAGYVVDLRALPGRPLAISPGAAAVTPTPDPPDRPRGKLVASERSTGAERPRMVAAAMLPIGAPPGGLDRATWQRFRGGSLRIERRLDLHGQTASHAFKLLEQVLVRSAAEGLRCLEVITGRGAGELGGILRRELPHWINLPHLRPLILAATHPHEGNTGSVRLLLRRPPRAGVPDPATLLPRTRR